MSNSPLNEQELSDAIYDAAMAVQANVNAQALLGNYRGEMSAESKLLIEDLQHYLQLARENQDDKQVECIHFILKRAKIDDYNSETGYDSDELYEDPQIRLAEHVKWAGMPVEMHHNIVNGKYEQPVQLPKS